MKKNSFLKVIAILFITASSLTIQSCKGPSDEDIKKNVTEKLGGMNMVSADVKDGTVTLSGECANEAEKTKLEAEVKSVKGVKSVVNNCTITPDAAAIPMPGPDDVLTTGVNDAIKSYDGVMATVKDGEITLTGTIKRSSLPNLMQALNTLTPKKINNQLTIK